MQPDISIAALEPTIRALATTLVGAFVAEGAVGHVSREQTVVEGTTLGNALRFARLGCRG